MHILNIETACCISAKIPNMQAINNCLYLHLMKQRELFYK